MGGTAANADAGPSMSITCVERLGLVPGRSDGRAEKGPLQDNQDIYQDNSGGQ